MKFKRFIKRLFCPHTYGTLLAISYDGVSTYECTNCGKHIEVGL